MKARRTYYSNKVFALPGGTEDNDLWVQTGTDDREHPVSMSTWELSADERALVAAGCNIELIVWGDAHPPVSLRVVNHPLGKRPPDA